MPGTEKIHCIIIEDEPPAAVILELHIAKIDFLHLQGSFRSVSKAFNFINNNKTDIIFLDINLPGLSGIDFAKSITTSTSIIFTTAYAEYAHEGFELAAIDYLLKPISFHRFSKAINRYMKYKGTGMFIKTEDKEIDKPFVFVKCERQLLKIYLADILYVEAKGNYSLIYKSDAALKTYLSISELEQKLPENMFARVHRSFLISLAKIESYTSSHLVINQAEIPVGRQYSAEAQKRIKERR